MARVIVRTDGKLYRFRQGLEYKYANGYLALWRDGNIIRMWPVRQNQAYALIFDENQMKLKKILPPKAKTRIIAWICNAVPSAYCTSMEEYEEKIRKYEEEHADEERMRIQVKGDYYHFFWTQKHKEYTPYSVACYISEHITNREVLELVPIMLKAGFSKNYVRNILITELKIPSHEVVMGMKGY